MQRIARIGAVLAASALSLTTLAAPATAAPRTDDSGAEAGARWLSKELTGGLLHNSAYDFDDVGLSVDAALAVAAVEDDSPVVDRIATAVGASLDGYAGTGTDTYAGATAKAAVLAQTAGRDPRSFGGRDLVATLERQVTDSGAGAGRLFDTSQYDDYANAIGQSFAARALAVAGSPEAAAARGYLLQQQCPAGFFRLYFAAKDAAAQGCTPGATGSEPDTDVTSIAVINLVLAGATDRASSDAVADAVRWLRSVQRRDGSFGGGTSTSKPNANSTGLAATALGMTEQSGPARKAAAWLRTLQPADVGACRGELTRERGAVAYDKRALKAGRKRGLEGDAEDQWRRATVQAVPALRYAPGAKGRLRVEAPAAARPGATVRVRIEGLAPGEQACLSAAGSAKRVTGASAKVTVVGLRMPRVAGSSRVEVRTLGSRAEDRVQVRR